MISTKSILKSLVGYFRGNDWSVRHFYIYEPKFIEELGFGDRKYFKASANDCLTLPEPHLALSKGVYGVIFEVDYKFSVTCFENIKRTCSARNNDAFLKRVFKNKVPNFLFYGIALPNTPEHSLRAKKRSSEVDILAFVGKQASLTFFKKPACI